MAKIARNQSVQTADDSTGIQSTGAACFRAEFVPTAKETFAYHCWSDSESGRLYHGVLRLFSKQSNIKMNLGERWHNLVRVHDAMLVVCPSPRPEEYYETELDRDFRKAVLAAERGEFVIQQTLMLLPEPIVSRALLENLSKELLWDNLQLLRDDLKKWKGMEPKQSQQQTIEPILATTETWTAEQRADLLKALQKQQAQLDGIANDAALPTIERPDAEAIIRSLKEIHGMTQRDIASAIGRSQSTIADAARGAKVSRPDLLQALERLFWKKTGK